MYHFHTVHKDFIIIHKVDELSFHSEDSSGLFKQVKQEFHEDLYASHRLDKVTTGLLLMARSQEAARVFGELFSKQLINKYYLAVSDHKAKKEKAVISGDMERTRKSQWKLLKSQNNPAVTKYCFLKKLDDLYYYLIQPVTGKAHQIRVAMKIAGAPILGDPLYYPKSKALVEADRTYLHAFALQFQYKNQSYYFSAPPNKGKYFKQPDFLDILANLNKPEEYFT
ncbi:MAG: pseudouridine synthase [Spirochaetes bacterium]|nr:pseudouridine synthase [Spirochaetota bacterium]